MGRFAKHMEMAREARAIWRRLIVRNGRLFRAQPTQWILECGGGGGFGIGQHRVIVGGKKLTIPAKPTEEATNAWCLMVYFDGRPPVWVDWDMDDDQPSDAEIYDPAATYGDIHVMRVP